MANGGGGYLGKPAATNWANQRFAQSGSLGANFPLGFRLLARPVTALFWFWIRQQMYRTMSLFSLQTPTRVE